MVTGRIEPWYKTSSFSCELTNAFKEATTWLQTGENTRYKMSSFSCEFTNALSSKPEYCYWPERTTDKGSSLKVPASLNIISDMREQQIKKALA